MIDFPSIQVPDAIAQLCSMPIKNNRQAHSYVFDLIENDPFLKILAGKIFSKFNHEQGTLGIVMSLGQEGVRNRLVEAYIFYVKNGHYPQSLDLDEVYDILDFEQRYDFLVSETSGRVFLLGFFLKLCDLHYEYKLDLDSSFLSIPFEVDEILVTGKSKNNSPDWLVLFVWGFFKIFGKQKALHLLTKSKGDLSEILSEISQADYEQCILMILRYGQAINDESFFVEQRV